MLKLARTPEEAGDQATESSGDQAKIYLVDKTAVIIGNFIQVQGVEEKIVFFCKNDVDARINKLNSDSANDYSR